MFTAFVAIGAATSEQGGLVAWRGFAQLFRSQRGLRGLRASSGDQSTTMRCAARLRRHGDRVVTLAMDATDALICGGAGAPERRNSSHSPWISGAGVSSIPMHPSAE